MPRRTWVRAILVAWIALLAPASVLWGKGGGDGAREGRIIEIAVDLQDGFVDDTVVISAEGHELFRDQHVSTRFQIGRAKSVRVAVPDGRPILTIDVPTRNVSTTVSIDTAHPVYVGISLSTQGKLEVKVQAQPFGYL